uniref:4-O-methyltransferase 1 n=1 Tax=Phanerochaete chrysosporium (strain RP-78 / ATCC MYA-4764 / FGSC 9002) TaxID=273507 RepID=OMT1_PHACR|nr:RecName: Full=4-O-methyltransferase 1; Short=Mtrase 1 [Phanerochaete chrysosporium RP-78]
MPSPLRQLLELMIQAVETLESVCEEKGISLPDLHAPYTPASEAFLRIPAAIEAANVITAAADHMSAIVSPPTSYLYKFLGGPCRAVAIRACLESNVSEIIREAGPSGIHVDDIAKKNGHDAQKLARFLRYLATHHIYREVSPDVFTHSRLSCFFDTYKPSAEVIANPKQKYDNTRGFAAPASHHLDITFKAAALAWETMDDPKTGHSDELTDAPFARAFPEDKTLWNLLERDAFARNRFDLTMVAVAQRQSPDSIFRAFDWERLPAGALVVEVGGGMGTSAFPLATKYPEMRLVVQDLPDVIAKAEKLWTEKMPDALSSGRVVLQGHDCFAPQPQTDAAVFLLKMILHDWSDEYCVKILRQLRAAARPDTALVIVDCLVPLACRLDDAAEAALPGAVGPQAPPPLLPNYGTVNEYVYNMDVMMHLLFNAQERTVAQFTRVLLRAGWRVCAVHRTQEGNGVFLQSVEAVPA